MSVVNENSLHSIIAKYALNKAKNRELLRKSKWVFDASEYPLVSRNADVLKISFENDYKGTIEAIQRLSPLSNLTFSKEVKERILEYLVKHKFCFNDDNMGLMVNSPLFLIAALYNNYEATMERLMAFPFGLGLDEDEESFLYSVLAINGFVYDDKTPKCLYYSKVAFKASVENDFTQTMYNFNYSPDLGNSVKEIIYNELLKQEPPATFWSQKIIEDPDILSKLVSEEMCDFATTRLFNKHYRYTESDEKYFLSLLGGKYTSIERYITHLNSRELNRLNFTMEEVLAINFYVRKVLSKYGCDDIKVNMFAKGKEYDRDALAATNNEEIFSLPNYEKIEGDSVVLLIHNLNHEICHILQTNRIRNMKFNEDPDIDVYQKEYILERFNKGYYGNNYHSLYIEFDAETRGAIDTCLLFGYDVAGYLKRVEDPAKFKDDDPLNNHYKLTYVRDDLYKEVEFNNVFEKCLEEITKELDNSYLEEFMEDLDRDYPLLKHEYQVVDNSIKRKSLEELAKGIDSEDSEIYKYLLTQRLVEYKDSHASSNREELERLIERNESLKNALQECIKKAEIINNDNLHKYRHIARKKKVKLC